MKTSAKVVVIGGGVVGCSVLYHLTSEKLAQLDTDNLILTASIHELVARTLGNRITYMNRRLFLELK